MLKRYGRSAAHRARSAERDIAMDGSPLALIVDDDEPTARLIGREVRAHCETAIAYDGLEGLDLALKVRPTLVITDVCMPHLDGISMVRRILASSASPDLRILFMTGDSDTGWRLGAWRELGSRFLLKPLSLDRLHEEVRRALVPGFSWPHSRSSVRARGT